MRIYSSGVLVTHLIKVYITFIRPGVEYAAPVWHPGFSKTLADNLESVRSSCPLLLFSDLSYREVLNIPGLQPLRDRRVDLYRKSALCLAKNIHFRHWRPSTRRSLYGRYLRSNHAFLILTCRAQSMLSSPVLLFITVALGGSRPRRYVQTWG